jgi:hypothetical protein
MVKIRRRAATPVVRIRRRPIHATGPNMMTDGTSPRKK